jgi:hypothetical protein
MADFEALTASSGVRIPKVQRQKLQDLIKEYDFGEVTTEIDNEGYLYIYGDEWLQVYHPPGTEGDEDATDDFLDKLREFIPKGETFEIHMIGHEKCRFPLSMSKVEITREQVTWTNL